MKKQRLDIIIPGYNPPIDWEYNFVEQALLLTKKIKGFRLRFILVDDGAGDKISIHSIQYIRDRLPAFHYLKMVNNRGKGFAIRKGVELSNSEILCFTDIDFPYEASNLQKMLHQLHAQKLDVVVGHRKKSYYRKISFFRAFLSSGLRKSIRWLFHLPVDDTQSGLKLFNQKGKEILLQTQIDRYLFDLEFLTLATKNGLKIGSIPLQLRENVELPPIPVWILFTEFKNLIRLLIRR